MRIVLLGPPGSGKMDLAEKISAVYGTVVITQTSVLDTAASESSELGRLAKEARDASRVSDELLLALLRIQLPKMKLKNGFVLVDMPKNTGQAEVLDELLLGLGKPVDLVINLQMNSDDLMERLVGHIECDNCGELYNMYVNPPMVDGVCDVCGARVSRRPDDYEETISNRLRVYGVQMIPVLDFYTQAEKLTHLDANGGSDSVWAVAKPLIDATPSPEMTTAAVLAEQALLAAVASSMEENNAAAAGKKPTKKKTAAKKKTVKKASTKKKAATKKVANKKATKKAVTKKAATKKKPVVKKAVTKKKSTVKKVGKKTANTKITAKKKSVAKKPPTKKITKKKVVKKTAKKKPVSKKVAKKKVARKKR